MSDFVADTGNQSLADWAEVATRADDAAGALCARGLQAGLQALEFALWTAETGAGSAGAALELEQLSRQMREATAALVTEATRAA